MVRGSICIVLWLAGCSAPPADPCAGFRQSCLALEVRPAPRESLSVDQLELRGISGFDVPDGNDALTPPLPGATVALPVLVAVLPPPDFFGSFDLEVRGLLGGQALRIGHAQGSLAAGQHLPVRVLLDLHDDGTPITPVDLAGLDLAGIDLGARDLASAHTVDLAKPCDPATQSGCGPGQKCTLQGGVPAGAPVCVAAGSVPVASGCSIANDQCVAGAICLQIASVDSICRQLCDHDHLDNDCPKPAAPDAGLGQLSHCLVLQANGSSLGACTTPCNPVTAAGPSGCPTGQRCYFVPFVNADVSGVTDCTTSAGHGTDGTPCSNQGDCSAGFYCRTIVETGQPVCRQLCRIGVNADCSLPSYTCVPDRVAFGGCCPGGLC
jgi:hypothetical protein